jgi:membrane associated rhomboid family serine protease
MLPLKDSIKSRTLPIVTYIILGLNILVFLYQMTLGEYLNEFISMYGAIPYNIFHPQGFFPYGTIFSSMFIHAGIMHIFGNMLFLWIFADNVEDRLGHIKFIFFYLICGVAAVLLHGVTAMNSTVPMVGASGAISGVLGAYIILYPKSRVLALIPFGYLFRYMVFVSIFIRCNNHRSKRRRRGLFCPYRWVRRRSFISPAI